MMPSKHRRPARNTPEPELPVVATSEMTLANLAWYSRGRSLGDNAAKGLGIRVEAPCELLLRVDVRATHRDRGELVAADAAIEEFLLARRGVEAPAVGLAHDRDGEGPVVRPDVEDGERVGGALDPHSLGGRGGEPLPSRGVVHRIARLDDFGTPGADDGEYAIGIAATRRHLERADRSLRGREQRLAARRSRPQPH